MQLADGMEMMVISIIDPAVHCQWMVPTWQQALLTSVSKHFTRHVCEGQY